VIAYNVEMTRREVGTCYPILGGRSFDSSGLKWPFDHLFGNQPEKNQQTFSAQSDNNLRNFLFFTQKFSAENFNKYI
jgi:hypothetical protein